MARRFGVRGARRTCAQRAPRYPPLCSGAFAGRWRHLPRIDASRLTMRLLFTCKLSLLHLVLGRALGLDRARLEVITHQLSRNRGLDVNARHVSKRIRNYALRKVNTHDCAIGRVLLTDLETVFAGLFTLGQ